jgi:hypothetical protein
MAELRRVSSSAQCAPAEDSHTSTGDTPEVQRWNRGERPSEDSWDGREPREMPSKGSIWAGPLENGCMVIWENSI